MTSIGYSNAVRECRNQAGVMLKISTVAQAYGFLNTFIMARPSARAASSVISADVPRATHTDLPNSR